MKQFPYCRPTNIRPHRKKSYNHGYLAPGIFAPLLTCASFLKLRCKAVKTVVPYRQHICLSLIVTVCLSGGCPPMCSPLYRTHCYCVGVSYYIMGVGIKGSQRPLILKFSSCVRHLEVLKNTNIDIHRYECTKGFVWK